MGSVGKATLGLVAAAIVLGGGTEGGVVGDAILQIVSVGIVCSLIGLGAAGRLHWRLASAIVLLTLALVALQFLPLGGQLAARLSVTGIVDGLPAWSILTATPHASVAAVVSFLPALAVVLLAGRADIDVRQAAVMTLVAMGAVSLALGFIQLAQGPRSALRFFEITNTMEAVGFFANRNHFAALMLATLVFAGAGLVQALGLREERGDEGVETLWIFIAGTLVVSALVGLTLARSRAGVILAIPALLGVVAIALRDARLRRAVARSSVGGNRLIFGALMAGVVLAVALGLGGLQARFGQDPLDDARFAFAGITWTALLAALPFGTGFASFSGVFAVAEPLTSLAPAYANRAHNDWLEWGLETGVPGILVLAMFICWYVVASVHAWTRRSDGGETFARAASIVILLLMLHSLVDYPLRTTALQVVFALCCVLLLPLPERATRAVSHGPRSTAIAAAAVAAPPPAPVVWTGTTEWPEAWRKPIATKRATDEPDRP